MKVLSFAAIEILPSLLNKTKVQTIKPAFCKDCGTESHWVNKKNGKGTRELHLVRFKVGDKVKLMWNQRSKYGWFCKKCGKGLQNSGVDDTALCPNKHTKVGGYEIAILNLKQLKKFKVFGKYLGSVEITEVFKIKLSKEVLEIDWLSYQPLVNIKNIAKLDGFKSAEQMFKWFDNYYNLSQPKAFWVYRWRWVA